MFGGVLYHCDRNQGKRLGMDEKIKRPVGKPRKFTPEEFEQAWVEYFEWCNENPWHRKEAIKSGERAGDLIDVPVSRPYSEQGFHAYHGLGYTYLHDFRVSLRDKEVLTEADQKYSNILTWAKAVCWRQKFEGASVGLFNAGIIARDLQLADVQKTELSGSVRTEVDYSRLSEETLEELARLSKDGKD